MLSVLMFIIGACLGSFYLVLGLRLPKEEDVLFSRSKCDHCQAKLSWWELIPIISYILLRGKCHHCKKRVSALNFLVEIITGGLFLFAYLYYGVSYEMFMFLVIISLTIIIFVSDFNYLIINDSPLIVSGILIAILKWYYLGIKELLISIVCGIALFVVMYLIKIIGDKIFKRESLGGGDIKFSFIIGLAVGYRLGLCVLILASFLSLPYSIAVLMLKKNNEVPYGPFLAASLFLVFAFSFKFLNLLNVLLISL